MPVDGSGVGKGYAFVQYTRSSDAIKAFQTLDGTPFQGRLLHVLPGEAPRNQDLDDVANSKLPVKKQNQIRQKAEATRTSFKWNSLYMNQDAVKSSAASRAGISKSELFDPTSADQAVKQAIAETSIIQEAKTYFLANGVDVNAFKSTKRGDASILVKGFPHGTTEEEIRTIFEEHGPVLRVLMPPAATIAIVRYENPTHGKAAFQALSYKRFKTSILLLEKGPSELFTKNAGTRDQPTRVQSLPALDLLERGDGDGDGDDDAIATTSLFVKNLNFVTTTDDLAEVFSSLDGFVSALVKTKQDAKKGHLLSMGFGFVAFRSKEQARAAQTVMDGFVLDGHTLKVSVSYKGLDAAQERRQQDAVRKAGAHKTKIAIKNLPFEATKKDVRTLLGGYGQLKSVRVPKNFKAGSRGFAFAEFTTPTEAQNALIALRDTHILGRRLVLEYANAEDLDPEEEIAKMQKKMGAQVNKVALQRLTGKGREKVTIGDNDEEDGLDA
jgi:multiple RNA-binding domain-containing protein 1